MKAVIQRVKQSSVTVNEKIVGQIQHGLLILLGVSRDDQESDADYLADKIANLSIFEDDAGKMNRSLLDVGGEALVVSQFTLFGDCRKGRRPSFIHAAPPEKANRLYEYFTRKLKDRSVAVQTGVFRAMMDVALVNDGPVTLILESA
jgi:D-tyrosyl-tRNA(Tyr) deacylase